MRHGKGSLRNGFEVRIAFGVRANVILGVVHNLSSMYNYGLSLIQGWRVCCDHRPKFRYLTFFGRAEKAKRRSDKNVVKRAFRPLCIL